MSKLIKWENLNQAQKQEVQRRYVHWHYDTTSKTFVEWAGKHAFWVKKDGELDNKHQHCEPAYMADDPYYEG